MKKKSARRPRLDKHKRPKPAFMTADYERGARDAAALVAGFNSESVDPFRVDDRILILLDIGTRSTPRRNAKRRDLEAIWLSGFATALAEMHRRPPGDSTTVREVARAAGLTIAKAKNAGVDGFDWKELRRAGVAAK